VILERYILRELITSFVFAFCTVLSVCLVGTMFQVFRTFPGVGFEVLSKALPLATGAMASWVMLVASCTSSTLVYARLAAENEITAMRTCGIHLWSIAAPAVLLGFLLVGAAYPLNEVVVPWSRHNRRLAFRDSLVFALRRPAAGQQDFRIGSTRIVYTDFVDGKMVRPTISKFKGTNLIMQVFAPSGTIVVNDEGPEVIIQIILTKPRVWQTGDPFKDVLILRDGKKVTGKITERDPSFDVEFRNPKEKPVSYPEDQVERFEPSGQAGEPYKDVLLLRDGKRVTGRITHWPPTFVVSFQDPKDPKKEPVRYPKDQVDRVQTSPVEEFTAENDLTLDVPTGDLQKLKRQTVDEPAAKLWERIMAAKDPKVRNPLLLILHTRYAASLTPLLLVLVGMPIGIMVSRGSRLAGLGAALPPLLIYFVSYFIFQGVGTKSLVHPLLAAYLPDLFVAAIAAVLLLVTVRR
jgi:lipopolysaccharide export LptBFGC system permease protein LptF